MNKRVNAAIAIRLGYKYQDNKWYLPGGGSQFDVPDFLGSIRVFRDILDSLRLASSFDANGWWKNPSAYYIIRGGPGKRTEIYGNWRHKNNHSGCRCLLKYLRLFPLGEK